MLVWDSPRLRRWPGSCRPFGGRPSALSSGGSPAPATSIDVPLVGLTNVVCQVGIAQRAVTAALTAPDADADVTTATAV